MPAELQRGIDALALRYGLSQAAAGRLLRYAEVLRDHPYAPTTVRTEPGIVDLHLADSLTALELGLLEGAVRVADIGSGAGLPGLPLAAAQPQARFALIESGRRKADFLRAVVDICGFDNVEVVGARVESWDAARESFDLVTARALAPLPVVAEWAAPLLRIGGHLVAWRGKREPQVEHEASQIAPTLGFCEQDVRLVRPFPAAVNHHLHVMSKVSPTPPGFPRRPGMARKRPLAARRPRV